jgi:hypothetical protein
MKKVHLATRNPEVLPMRDFVVGPVVESRKSMKECIYV